MPQTSQRHGCPQGNRMRRTSFSKHTTHFLVLDRLLLLGVSGVLEVVVLVLVLAVVVIVDLGFLSLSSSSVVVVVVACGDEKDGKG